MAGVVYGWRSNPMLSLVTGTAMLGNFLVAAIMGVFVPMTLCRWSQPWHLACVLPLPQNILGFALFLGMAGYFILWLI